MFLLYRLLLVLLLGTAAGAAAQPAPTDPREPSEAVRRAYTQGLQEARQLLAAKKYDEATARINQLLQDRPREIQARFLLGLVQTDQGRIDDAIATLRALLSDYPELVEARNNLAVLLAQKGEYALARDELERAVSTSPDYAVAHENLGDVYARLAEEQYRRTVDLDKRNKSAPGKLKLVQDVNAGR
jgi:Tfp pilus assembly protein PilF